MSGEAHVAVQASKLGYPYRAKSRNVDFVGLPQYATGIEVCSRVVPLEYQVV